jgi:hypothetical protein|nr:MAG TPA: hypothetical protein [Caudoviricetes sp.]
MGMTEEENKKMLEALKTLAFGGQETKTVIQYKNNPNGRKTEIGRTVTEVNKLPDRSALLKLMEIEGVYIDANVKLKQQKVDEVSTEKELVDLVEGLAIE